MKVFIKCGKLRAVANLRIKKDMVMKGSYGSLLPGAVCGPFKMKGVDVNHVREVISYNINEGLDACGTIECLPGDGTAPTNVTWRVNAPKQLAKALGW